MDFVSIDIGDASREIASADDEVGHQWFDNESVIKTKLGTSKTFEDLVLAIDAVMQVNDVKTFKSNINSLIIEKIILLKRTFFIGHHEMMAVCINDINNKSPLTKYYFLLDRGANYKFATKVRIIYLGKSNICDEKNKLMPQWTNRSKVFLKRTNKYVPDRLDSNKKSFKILLRMVKLYVSKFWYYNIPTYNCQHFATGFYNVISSPSKKIETINTSLTEYDRDSLDLFNNAVKEEVDESKPNALPKRNNAKDIEVVENDEALYKQIDKKISLDSLVKIE
jgi:hypothetical protein